MRGNIETVFVPEGDKYVIPAGVKHRVKRGDEPYIEISRNGGDGFWRFSTEVTYYRFNGCRDLHHSPIPQDELEQFKNT
jgi:hypothetical protein